VGQNQKTPEKILKEAEKDVKNVYSSIITSDGEKVGRYFTHPQCIRIP